MSNRYVIALLCLLAPAFVPPASAQNCLAMITARPAGPQIRYVETFSHAPIAGMEVCDRLIVTSGAVGPFAGHENEYAYYVGGNPSLAASWDFQEPLDGDLAYVASTARYFRFRNLGFEEWKALAFEPTSEAATTTFQGAVLEITVDSDVAIVWKLSGQVLPIVCREPFIAPDDCGVQGINDPVCGTAHIAWYAEGPYAAGPHLMVNSLEPCP